MPCSLPAACFACILLLFFAQHPFEVNPISSLLAPPVPSLHPEGAKGYALAKEKDLRNGQGRSIRSAKKHKKVTFIPPIPDPFPLSKSSGFGDREAARSLPAWVCWKQGLGVGLMLFVFRRFIKRCTKILLRPLEHLSILFSQFSSLLHYQGLKSTIAMVSFLK
jgi:hypothetical protein